MTAQNNTAVTDGRKAARDIWALHSDGAAPYIYKDQKLFAGVAGEVSGISLVKQLNDYEAISRSRTHLHDVVIPQIRAREQVLSDQVEKLMDQLDELLADVKAIRAKFPTPGGFTARELDAAIAKAEGK